MVKRDHAFVWAFLEALILNQSWFNLFLANSIQEPIIIFSWVFKYVHVSGDCLLP